ncbi:MAG: hypothetical protein IT378_06190 [Sandaracinaceae bacterium]|nr:hypothetical protein [Sandaracinaceae bacterium]
MTGDPLVFVIDLRAAAREEDAAVLATGHGKPRALPSPPAEDILQIAIITNEGEPRLLPIEPTRDVRWLDALARLVRVGVQLGLAPSEIASRYGSDDERAMRLPLWAHSRLQ